MEFLLEHTCQDTANLILKYKHGLEHYENFKSCLDYINGLEREEEQYDNGVIVSIFNEDRHVIIYNRICDGCNNCDNIEYNEDLDLYEFSDDFNKCDCDNDWGLMFRMGAMYHSYYADDLEFPEESEALYDKYKPF